MSRCIASATETPARGLRTAEGRAMPWPVSTNAISLSCMTRSRICAPWQAGANDLCDAKLGVSRGRAGTVEQPAAGRIVFSRHDCDIDVDTFESAGQSGAAAVEGPADRLSADGSIHAQTRVGRLPAHVRTGV